MVALPVSSQRQEIVSLINKKMEEGEVFTVSNNVLSITALTNIDIMLVVPGGNSIRVRPFAYHRNDGSITLYENVTTSADGIPALCINRNRPQALRKQTNVLAFTQPTISNLGTMLETRTTVDKVESDMVMPVLWVLGPGKHLFRFTNLSVSTQLATLIIDFFEDNPLTPMG